MDNQLPSTDSVYISWLNKEIGILKRDEEYSYIEHIKSGRKLHIPNLYIRNESECRDYTNYLLPVKADDTLSIIFQCSKGYIVKKDGVIGWYCGKVSK